MKLPGVPLEGQRAEKAALPAAAFKVTLRVLTGTGKGDTHQVERFPAVIGRSVTCDIVLRDDPTMPTISRQHLRIDLAGLTLTVEDLSSNGTRMGNRPMVKGEVLPLPPNTTLWLGPNTTLQVEMERRLPLKVQSADSLNLQVVSLGPVEVLVDGVAIPHSAWPSSQAFCLLVMLIEGPAEASPPGEPPGWNYDGILRALGQGGDPRLCLKEMTEAFARWPGATRLPTPFLAQSGRISLAPIYQPQLDVEEVSRLCQGLDSLSGVALLERLEEVARVWQGPFLAGFQEPWAVHRRGQVEGWLQESVQRLSGETLPGPVSTRALAFYRTMLEHDPCHLSVHLALLRELARAGQFDEMKVAIAGYEQALEESEGVRPSAALRQAWKRLLDARFGNS